MEFELLVLDDGEKAVEFIDRLDGGDGGPSPDLVLLDLNLPKKSGGQVLERVRQSPVCGHIPVVVLTSSDSPKDKNLAAQFQATEYFKKPSRLDEYMQLGPLVRDLLAAHAHSR
jgi:CheY-like chemotaxis protein